MDPNIHSLSGTNHPLPLTQKGTAGSIPRVASRSSFQSAGELFNLVSTSSQNLKAMLRNSLDEDDDIIGNSSVKEGKFDISELEKADTDVLKELKLKGQDLLENDNFAELSKLLDEIGKNKASNLVYTLLKNNAGNSKIYNKLMDFIASKYNISKVLEKPDKDRIITMKGVKVLVEYLKQKGSLDIDCKFCESYQDLEATLNQIKDMKEDNFRIGIFFRTWGGNEYMGLDKTHHITPILIEKRNGVLYAVVTDSTGNKGKYTFFLCKQIQKSLQITPLSFREQRQWDLTNCPIFSLRDMVQISKTPDFLDFCMRNINSKSAALHEFNKLPPSMMKVAQNLDVTESYKEEMVESKKAQGGKEKLSETLERHKGTINNRAGVKIVVNTLVASRFKKYERIIIASLIAQTIK